MLQTPQLIPRTRKIDFEIRDGKRQSSRSKSRHLPLPKIRQGIFGDSALAKKLAAIKRKLKRRRALPKAQLVSFETGRHSLFSRELRSRDRLMQRARRLTR